MILYFNGAGRNPVGPYRTSMTATAKPKIKERTMEAASILKVARIDGAKMRYSNRSNLPPKKNHGASPEGAFQPARLSSWIGSL